MPFPTVIACTLYRRPARTRQLLECLAGCYGIADYAVLFSCDFAEGHRQECEEVISLARAFNACEKQVFVHNPRLGVDLNKLFVLPRAFDLSDYVIFLEDDTHPSQDALRYFEYCGQRFTNDQNVLSVSGYNRTPERARDIDPYQLHFRPAFCPWGWATWKDRFDARFGDGGARYRQDTGDAANGLFDHWLTSGLREGEGCIYPELARTTHAAWEAAEHTPSRQWWEANEDNGDCWAGRQEMPDPSPDAWKYSE